MVQEYTKVARDYDYISIMRVHIPLVFAYVLYMMDDVWVYVPGGRNMCIFSYSFRVYVHTCTVVYNFIHPNCQVHTLLCSGKWPLQ